MNQTGFHRSKEPGRSSGYCKFHPWEVYVGVCPNCLRERLVTLASLKQSHYNKHRSQHYSYSNNRRGKSFSLTARILALGTYLNRVELLSQKTFSQFSSNQEIYSGSSSSQEDSFISIKFEENGVALWDKDRKNQTEEETGKDFRNQGPDTKHIDKQTTRPHASESSHTCKSKNSSVNENTRGGAMRWRKRLGHVFEHIPWRSGSNTNIAY